VKFGVGVLYQKLWWVSWTLVWEFCTKFTWREFREIWYRNSVPKIMWCESHEIWYRVLYQKLCGV